MNAFKPIILLLAFQPLLACTTSFQHSPQTKNACHADPRAMLLATHERARHAHLKGDASNLAADSAEIVISVQDGEITRSTRSEILARFRNYFRQVEYRRWDNLEQPEIQISRDGTLGWMAVKIVGEIRNKTDESDGEWESFHSSWIATYQRIGCDWQMVGIASEVVPQ